VPRRETTAGRWLRRTTLHLATVAVVGMVWAPGSSGRTPPEPAVGVVLETALGSIALEIDPVDAPVTAANFLRYVDAGQYDGGRFHRTVRPGTETNTAYPIALIQASRAPGTAGFAPIRLEATPLRHVDGAVAMARSGAGTATSDFYICVGAQPALDAGGARPGEGGGLAVFGRVVSGMAIVRQIQAAPVFPGTQTLEPPIRLTRARRKANALPFPERRAILPVFFFVRG
jgi:peptidyl-prolyl cis-trans isomerase A (cyclophilin A)